MLFSVKERIDTARRLMLEFLLNQVQEKDYCILPKLYEMAKIDNKKLLEKAHTSRNIFDTPSNTVFSDMVYFDLMMKQKIIQTYCKFFMT